MMEAKVVGSQVFFNIEPCAPCSFTALMPCSMVIPNKRQAGTRTEMEEPRTESSGDCCFLCLSRVVILRPSQLHIPSQCIRVQMH